MLMALAGAERIFGLIDEKPEEDEGDVTLVRVKCDDKELNNKEADNKDARMVFIAGEVTETTDKDLPCIILSLLSRKKR